MPRALGRHSKPPNGRGEIDAGENESGPGRDLKAFTGLGHVAVDLEGAARFAEMARVELAHYCRPAGLPLERQPWLATVWRNA